MEERGRILSTSSRYLFDEISLHACQKKEIKMHHLCFNKSKNTELASEKNMGMCT
jgi:hypothetical protein